MSINHSNSWLRAQRKSDLVELAESIGFKNFESLKKAELESALDEYIAENSGRLSHRSDLTGYFNSRSRALGSPVKRESRDSVKDEPEKGLLTRSSAKRRPAKPVEDSASSSSDEARASTSALTQTPGRSLSRVASRISLPATPADVAMAVDRSTTAMRRRMHTLYQDSGFTEASNATRESLSTVTSILFCVSAFELFFIRPEILSNRYAFTIPAMAPLGTPDYPVYLPDMFLVLTSSFWSPALTWLFTSLLIPCLFGFFFNLTATNSASGPKTRARSNAAETVIDPLTFSIIKALVSYVVYAQRTTFCGFLSETSIVRLNGAVYGGYKGMLVGSAITGLVSIYDAVLKK